MAIKIPIVTEFDKKGIRSAEATLNQFGKNLAVTFAAVGAAAVVAGAGIVKFGNDSVQAASTLSESLNAVKVAYGDASESIVKLGEDSATRLGVTQSAFNAAAVRFSSFAERVVGTGGDVSGFVDDITTRAADFASVFNIDVAEALQVFQSGLSGEAEPLKRFGINLLDSEVKAFALRTKLIGVGQEMTEQQKVQARYGLLMEATNKTAGDFANTSGGLANQQRILKASFEDLQAEVGTALLPVIAEATGEFGKMIPTLKEALVPIAENLAGVFKTQVLPAIQNFTNWLASPAGIQKVKDLTQAIIDGTGKLFDFGKAVFDNWEKITQAVAIIGTLVISYKTLTTALEVAKAMQLLFNVSVIASPIGLLISVLGLAAVAATVFAKEVNADTIALKKNANQVSALEQEQIQLQEKIKQGGLGFQTYQKQLIKVNDRLMEAKTGFSTSAGEANKFNNLKFSGVNGEIDATARRLKGLANQFGETTGEARRFADLAPDPAASAEEEGGGGGGGGQTAAEKAAEARKKVQELIKDTRKQVIAAQSDYRKAVAKANSDFLANEVKIQSDYADKFADIIEQSKNRIRDAFRSVASFTVGTFLNDFRQVEEARLRSFEDAKKVAEDLGNAFTDVFIAGDPVQAYLESLRAKVAANQKVLQVSAKLLERGFSQTFIEQIIATGEDGGLALAEGILSSNPEVLKEIQTLYKDIEQISETGANALADQLYEQQGLATRELNKLYEKTQEDLLDALAENYADYTDTLADAATALKESITDISADFAEAILEMEGDLGGLANTVRQFQDMLKGVYSSTTSSTNQLSPRGGAKTTDGVGFAFDLNEALGTSVSNTGATQGQTVINVNVSTDATQSNAMVGQVVAQTITRYVRYGGQVLVE